MFGFMCGFFMLAGAGIVENVAFIFSFLFSLNFSVFPQFPET
jgi:hypothetical protein